MFPDCGVLRGCAWLCALLNRVLLLPRGCGLFFLFLKIAFFVYGIKCAISSLMRTLSWLAISLLVCGVSLLVQVLFF